jgi:hypothetical protein
MPTHPNWRIVVQKLCKAIANATPKQLKLSSCNRAAAPDDAPFKVFDFESRLQQENERTKGIAP